jgi:hypothetical protein
MARGLLGTIGDVATPRNGDDDGDSRVGGRTGGRTGGRRRRPPPVEEKAKGRHVKIPDSVWRRVVLEAVRRGWDTSRLVTFYLNQKAPSDISIVVGDENGAADGE